jgi:hypothetical protein
MIFPTLTNFAQSTNSILGLTSRGAYGGLSWRMTFRWLNDYWMPIQHTCKTRTILTKQTLRYTWPLKKDMWKSQFVLARPCYPVTCSSPDRNISSLLGMTFQNLPATSYTYILRKAKDRHITLMAIHLCILQPRILTPPW